MERTTEPGEKQRKGGTGDAIADLGEMGFNPVDVAGFDVQMLDVLWRS